MDAEGAQVPGCAVAVLARNGFAHAEVPEAYPAVGFGGDEFAHAASLEMTTYDPGFMVRTSINPIHDHGIAGSETLVVGADAAVPEPGDEDVAFDLVGGEGGDAGA